MSDLALRRSSSLPTAALALGIASIVVYFVGGIALDDWFWLVGVALGIVAVGTGFVARRDADGADRKRATIGMVIGAIPLVWFIAYVIVSAVS